MLKVSNWRILPLLSLIIVSVLTTPVISDPVLLPRVTPGEEPIIDGNMTTTSTEWQDSVSFNTTINGDVASIRVSSNSSDLFIALNYTDSEYIPVNGTSYNTTTNLNLETHDWLAFQFDNNLDKVDLGSELSPDDAVVFHQFNNSIFDSYMIGNASYPFFTDGQNNGTANGVYKFTNETNSLVYELAKPLDSGDVNGSDISLHSSIIQFKINSFSNSSSNATIFESSEWFSLRINVNGTGVALKAKEDVTINLSVLDTDMSQYQALETVLDQFGFELTISPTLLIGDADLNIVVYPGSQGISSPAIDTIISSIEQGGKFIISVGNPANATSLFESLGLSFQSNAILKDGKEELEFKGSEIIDLPFTSGVSLATNETATNLSLTAASYNVSRFENKTATPFFLRQDYFKYELLSMENTVLDENGDGSQDADEVRGKGLSIGTAWDLEFGGRLGLFSSANMFADDYFASSDNMYYLLRSIPWFARLVNTLEIHETTLDTHFINSTESVTINVNVTDGFGDNPSNLAVTAFVIQATGVVSKHDLTLKSGFFTSDIQVNATGSLSIKVVAKLIGYGFAVGEEQNLFAEYQVPSFNDLSEVNVWLAIIFILSLGTAIFSYTKARQPGSNEN